MSTVTSQTIHQGHLEHQLRKLFPGEKIFVESKKLSNLKYPTTDNYLELDFWLPDYNLCFEFQDSYHYITTWYTRHNLGFIQNNDKMKQNVTHRKGITLVLVPCWWDANLASLVSSIHFQRPDLFSLSFDSPPISLNPPPRYFHESDIPEIGELMSASFPINTKFISSIPDNSWWVGEKYDGVRFCWNPVESTMFSRSGRKFLFPRQFTSTLPRIFLDGELWFGRGNFSYTHALCKSAFDFVAWDQFRMITFDVLPDLPNEPFEDRYTKLIEYCNKHHPFLVLAKRTLCKNSNHLKKEIEGIIEEEGEGVICRLAGSIYIPGRSPDLVKLKASYGDTEALVVGVDAESNVLLKLPNGHLFVVPTSQVHLGPELGPPQPKLGPLGPLGPGDVVTFSYEQHARREGPVNATILRIRNDVSWEEVVRNTAKERKFRNEVLQSDMANLNVNNFVNNDINFQDQFFEDLVDDSRIESWREIQDRRQIFENYAKNHLFDPLCASNWYSQSKHNLSSIKGIGKILSLYDFNIAKALVSLFPEIGLDKSKLNVLSGSLMLNDVTVKLSKGSLSSENFWTKENNIKLFFERVAENFNFSPLVADNWYSFKLDNFSSFKGSESILQYYEGNWIKALVDVFPSLHLDELKFIHFPLNFWNSVTNRRWIFCSYAKHENFDPEISENWISHFRKLFVLKPIQGALQHYSGDMGKALSNIFPDVLFDYSKFPKLPGSYMQDIKNRQLFFEKFAVSRAFNMLEADNWYSVPFSTIRSQKASHVGLKAYDGDIVQALLHLFPKMNFDPAKFTSYRENWQDESNRKQELIKYAQDNRFDPYISENWSTFSLQSLCSISAGLKEYYVSHNFSDDISHLFGHTKNSSIIANPGNYWANTKNQKKLFENFAENKGFDHLNAANWYKITVSDFSQFHQGKSLIGYYKGSLINALIFNFPNIGLDSLQFSSVPKNYWQSETNQKKFFELYAKDNGFDPLHADPWYNISRPDILERKGGYAVLKQFKKRNVITALTTIFPDIGLQPSKFKHVH